MPTLNPRVNVTLSPSLDVLVGQLASHDRISKSMVLRELLEAAEPALRQAVALMEAAKGASVKARKTLAQDLDQNIRDAETLASGQLQILANHTRDLVDDAQAIKGRRPARASRRAAAPVAAGGSRIHATKPAKRPPSSNRGVKS
jgi:hypothetical protein